MSILERKVMVTTARCPRCGHVLYTSNNPEYTYQCLDCDEDFYQYEARYGSKEAKDAAIEQLWTLIEDEPFNPETECFETKFFGIDNGTDAPLSRDDVWHWFDISHSKGVYYLLYQHHGDAD